MRLIFSVLLLLCLAAPLLADPVLGRARLEVRDEARNKTLLVDVWYPVAPGTAGTEQDGPFITSPEARDVAIQGDQLPLVMLSHGFHGQPANLSWIAQALVARGYVVAGPTHDDPNRQHLHMNHWERARDISAALTGLLDSPLGQHLDEQRVGMVGYSLGGGTGIWLAGGLATTYRRTANPGADYAPQEEFFPVGSVQYNQLMASTDFEQAARSYRDPRLKAFFLLAPSLGWAFDAENLEQVGVPMEIVLGTRDEMLVPRSNGEYFAGHVPDCQLRVVEGAGHYVFLDLVRSEALRADPALAEIAVDPPGVDRLVVHQEVAGWMIEFFDQNLR